MRQIHSRGRRKETVEFQYPADVQQAIQGFQQKHAVGRQTLVLPDLCRSVLSSASTLTSQEASVVYEALTAIDVGENNDLDEDMKESARAAAAVTLLTKAPEWLAQNSAAQQKARGIFHATMAAIGDSAEPRRARYSVKQSALDFAAHFVAVDWIANPSAETDEAVMRF